MQFSAQDLVVMYKDCKEQTKTLIAEPPWMREQFLTTQLQDAMKNKKDEEAIKIKEILRNEVQKKTWAAIHRELNQKQNASVNRIEVPRKDGSTRECTTKESVEEGIAQEISSRFSRADSAPICQGALFELLGYLADTKTATAILEGTFVPLPGTDGPTIIILEEIARIWEKKGEGEVNIVISKEDFK